MSQLRWKASSIAELLKAGTVWTNCEDHWRHELDTREADSESKVSLTFTKPMVKVKYPISKHPRWPHRGRAAKL